MDRLTRNEAAVYLGCSASKLCQMEKGELLEGTYYELGAGKRNRRLYITHRLDEWMLAGGEPAARERKEHKIALLNFANEKVPDMQRTHQGQALNKSILTTVV